MSTTRWVVDGNNVFGSRPDGWWNDRGGAMRRFTQTVAAWCRGHDDPVLIVFDRPVDDDVIALGGGNLTVRAATRSGRNGADDAIVAELDSAPPGVDETVIVVTSDAGLRSRLGAEVHIWGVGRFRDLIGY